MFAFFSENLNDIGCVSVFLKRILKPNFDAMNFDL